MNPKNFFGELKRRNVYKVAVAYAIVAWLLIQAASILFPTFEAPPWVMKVFVVVILFGFPVALVFSWAFEITPEGIKREKDVPPHESITPQTGRKLVVLTTIVAVIAAGLFAYQLTRSRSTDTASSGSTSSRSDAAASGAIPEKSIAVLPFDNLSDEKSNAYFAEGIQDEILTRLSKIAALKVISRSSTQKYKSAPDNLREVGRQLGVANLLEGSVQKIANAVHVNVQLIRAATDEHLWAESYNRKLDDVFGVEGEVASTIADQLNAKLTGAEQKAVSDKPTQNTAAYDAYLRGLSIEHSEYSYDAYQRAARNYVEAVELDPKFALAWARLGVIRSFLYFNGIESTVNTPNAVKEAADRAMALAPQAGESWIAQGAYRYRILRDFESAVAAYNEALKRLPNSTFVYQNLAAVQRRLGRWQEAEASYKKAMELDPRDAGLLNTLGNEFYTYLRRFDDARAVLDRALEIAPDSETAHTNKATLLQNEGRLQDAAKEIALIPPNSTDVWAVNAMVAQAVYERRYSDAIKIIERELSSLPAGQPLDFFGEFYLVQLGFCQEWSGRPDEARGAFNRALQATKPTPDTVIAPDANGKSNILALIYAGLGEKEKALQQAQQSVKDYATDAVAKPASEVTLAQIQARFGDSNSAIAAIPHLLEVPAGLTIANLKVDPFWDPLRKDPRFAKIIAASQSR